VPSHDVFVEELIQALRAGGETRAIRYDAEVFCLLIGDNKEFADVVVRLNDAFQKYEKLSPEVRASEIHHLATLCRQPRVPENYQEVAPRLQLCVRHISYLHLHEELAATWPSRIAPPSLVHSKITDELILCVGLTDGETLRLLTEAQAARWKISTGKLIRIASRNQFKSALVFKRTGSVWRSLNEKHYAAADFVVGHLLATLSVRGSPVVLLPSRDSLIVTGSEDMEGLTQMAAIGHVEIEEAQYPVSGRPLTWNGRLWTPFQPPDKVRATFAHLEQAYEVDRYEEQSRVLGIRYSSAADGTQIAEVRIYPDGSAFQKVALWHSGSPVLLPVADAVALHDRKSGAVEVVLWKDVLRVLGEHLVPMHKPLRYRAERFPTLAEIEAMKLQVVERALPRPVSRPQGPRPEPTGFTKR